ncbi:endoplasmic reticulum membrane-associated RNA degradation protein isoform X1 [Stomoxys calcitrans]|uniref:endoplasmic reticulum membrane-associated RNA degradation protein isoform X1 n=1 Tax=Stomoxys calcitrans TaxID=35570 RepID=UPI0027E2C846|nr:endoplasmic reticulum membrane-associated RNA degradation protein isoform X1 [Stomoxys calcitrans]
MFPLEKKSLINEKILIFYREFDNVDSDNLEIYFTKENEFNARTIVELLFPECQDMHNLCIALNSFKYEDFVKYHSAMLPIHKCAEILVHTWGNPYFSSSGLMWMGVNSKFFYENMMSVGTCKYVEHILLMTSLLENALSNIYYTETKGKQAPHLLKDLISTPEVERVFDTELIILLKILMGIPNSINLRNIVWHGFPKPFEIPLYYECVLLIMIHTLGQRVKANNYVINERPLIRDFTTPLDNITNEIKMPIKNISFYEEKIMEIENDFAQDYVPFWLQLCSHYRDNNNFHFIMLAMPQIELLLRLHYSHINGVDVSAKLHEYYITMDTIFETEVASNRTTSNTNEDQQKFFNKLLDFAAYPQFQGTFHLIYDIFLCPNGCRLRDKVSHGEVYWQALQNSQLATVVCHIFLNLLTPLTCNTLENYESNLHLNCLNKKLFFKVKNKLLEFASNYNLPSNHIIATKETPKSKVLIFKRPRKESELMLLIKSIMDNVLQTLENYERSMAKRLVLQAQHELHSKRRKTLEKLQNALPQIFGTLMILVNASNILYNLLQNNYELVLQDDAKYSKTLRFLKHARTIAENLVRYSHYQSNEWIKSLELCDKFQEIYNKLFLYME